LNFSYYLKESTRHRRRPINDIVSSLDDELNARLSTFDEETDVRIESVVRSDLSRTKNK